MSTPFEVTCYKCKKKFIFLRGALEKCTHCGEEYKSHRDIKKENKK